VQAMHINLVWAKTKISLLSSCTLGSSIKFNHVVAMINESYG